MLRLVDEGALALDDALSKYGFAIPDDPRAARITARHVLSHASGLPNWRGDARLRTNFDPGERFSYSGEGFACLQKVVERITAQPLETLLKELVLDPLEMKRSSYVWQERFEIDHAAPHDAATGPGVKARPAQANAAFSLHTTAIDYAQFLRAVLRGTGLKNLTAQLWLRPQLSLPKGHIQTAHLAAMPELDQRLAWGLGWGLGWGLEPAAGAFFHWGANPGFEAFAIGSPQADAALAAFTNGDNGLALMPDIVAELLPGDHPSLDWLGLAMPQPSPG